MVKLVSLQAHNFKKLAFEKPLDLPEGITLISGNNESGKSTILDAILYALYGRMIKPSARPSNEEIISYGTNKAFVRLEFSVGEKRYIATREVYKNKPNQASLVESIGDKHKPLANGSRAVNGEIERLLGGITFEEIVSSNVVAQKDLERLVKQGREDRKKVINAFLNLESFNIVRDSLNEEKNSIEGTTGRIGRLQHEREKLAQLQEELEEFNAAKKDLEGILMKIGELEEGLARLRSRWNEINPLYEALVAYDAALKKKNELEAKLEGQKGVVTNLAEQLKGLDKVEEKLDESRSKSEGYKDLEGIGKNLESAGEKLEKLREMSSKIGILTGQKEQAEQDVSGREKRLSEVDISEIEDLRHQRGKLGPYLAGLLATLILAFASYSRGIHIVALIFFVISLVLFYLTATQVTRINRLAEMEGEYREYLSEKEYIRKKGKDVREIEDQLQKLRANTTGLKAGILTDIENIPRYVDVFSEIRQEDPLPVYTEIKKLFELDRQERDKLAERAANLANQLQERPKIEEKKEAAIKAVSEIESRIKGIEFPKLPEGMEFSDELLRETTSKREELNRGIPRVETELQESEKRQRELKQYLEEREGIEGEVVNQAAIVENLENKLKVLKLALEAVDNTSSALRARIKPQVERYMGLILPAITSGRYKAVQIDEDYKLKVWDPDAGEFKVREVFSGGTDDQFLLSMRLAFALALMPEAKGSHPEFLFLDEPLGSSDEIRRAGILELLSTSLAENFKQIFLISHVGLSEADMPNVIRLEDGRASS